jgi:hypothetical protein
VNSSIAARNASSMICGAFSGPGVHRLESHRVNLGQALERLSRSGNLRNALANRRRIIGALAARLANPLHPPLGQNGLLRHVQNPVLERSAADIWNKTFHF